jgi:hypothetical protein
MIWRRRWTRDAPRPLRPPLARRLGRVLGGCGGMRGDVMNDKLQKQTAFGALERSDRRFMRSRVLVAEIMHIISPMLDPESDPRQVLNALYELFMTQGIEILTDFDRSDLGLPPRDKRGWTAEEILALEKRRLEMLMSPVSMRSFVQPPSKESDDDR